MMKETRVEIAASSFFGARHGLETLSQLIVKDGSLPALLITKEVRITDSPAYPHRGLLIDTSRNFVSVATIEKSAVSHLKEIKSLTYRIIAGSSTPCRTTNSTCSTGI